MISCQKSFPPYPATRIEQAVLTCSISRTSSQQLVSSPLILLTQTRPKGRLPDLECRLHDSCSRLIGTDRQRSTKKEMLSYASSIGEITVKCSIENRWIVSRTQQVKQCCWIQASLSQRGNDHHASRERLMTRIVRIYARNQWSHLCRTRQLNVSSSPTSFSSSSGVLVRRETNDARHSI